MFQLRLNTQSFNNLSVFCLHFINNILKYSILVPILAFFFIFSSSCTKKMPERQAFSELSQRAYMYFHHNKYDSAIFFFHKTLERTKRATESNINCLLGITQSYLALELYDSAEIYFNKINKLDILIGKSIEPYYDYCKGSILLHKEKFTQSEEVIRKAIDEMIEMGSAKDTSLAEFYNKLGGCYYNLNMLDTSIFYFKLALTLAQQKYNPTNV
jgi:tetratricopeptide (TPR) repeat protein